MSRMSAAERGRPSMSGTRGRSGRLAAWCGVSLLLTAVWSHAAELKPFTGAEIAYQQSLGDVQQHEIPVARARRSGGFVQPREVETVQGQRRSVTWGHPRGVSSDEVYAHLRAQLPEEAWFECTSRACGPSSFWAHTQFEVSDLHGQDGSQFFAAVPARGDDQARIHLLYVVQRGTREVLAHWEEILVEGELPR